MAIWAAAAGGLLPAGGEATIVFADEPTPEAAEFFEREIRPVLVKNCYQCHANGKRKGDLDLTTRANVLAGGESGPAAVPGKPEESLIAKAVGYADDVRMPPDGKLKDSEIVAFRRWTELGVPWPNSVAPASAPARSAFQITDQQRRFWSFQPVTVRPAPLSQDTHWPRSEIDRYILAGLEQNRLQPAPQADRRTLLRRTTFDLIGLPPTPEEVEAFLADESPEALAKVVDRLLASPRYGERWGRHWLDVVRYADARDLIQLPPESDFREAWRYRDWVVKAFNEDLPYDDFIRKQIAGDLLQPDDPEKIDQDALVATGMLALADFVPGDVDKKQMIADYVNDQIDVVGRGILGLTLACARCHDHKFDPISTKDYYALAGIFFSTRLIPGPIAGNTPLVRAPLIPPAEFKRVEAQAQLDKKRIEELTRQVQLQLATDRGRPDRLGQIIAELAPRYARAAWTALHPDPADQPTDVAKLPAEGLDATILERWTKYLKDGAHPALAKLLACTDKAAREQSLLELGEQLSQTAARRDSKNIADPVLRSLRESEVLSLRADDPGIQTDKNGRIKIWPDHAGIPDDASPVANGEAPMLATCEYLGRSKPALRFSGKQTLRAARAVPPTGSLFVVFRAADQSPKGQRLVGWEDSSAGQHGLGLMVSPDGSLQAVMRRNGASGDVVVPPKASDCQIVSVLWGPGGVVVHRNGEPAGTNAKINNVSSAPDIPYLNIGAPGSGSAVKFQGDLFELRVYDAPLDGMARAAVETELQNRWLASAAGTPSQPDPVEDLFETLLSFRGPLWKTDEERARFLPKTEVEERLAAMRQELAELNKKQAVEIPRAVVVQEGGPENTDHAGFHDAMVYIRGNPANRGPIVPRGFPRVLVSDEQPPIQQGSGRRELAEWLTRPEHPLTARVMVNRIWKHHFGQGLVRTSSNFGARGDLPSHPELLDYLANRFVASGWSVKAMHRLIVLSSVYQQSCQPAEQAAVIDPDNRLLSHMNRRRLEAEAIRDSLLSVAGRLDATSGGPGFLELATPRRSLYLMSVRSGAKASDFARLFDGANCSAIIEQRADSTVAPQALFLLNDPFAMDQAGALANRVAREVPGDNITASLYRLYKIALARPPRAEEIEVAKDILGPRPSKQEWLRYSHVLLCTNEFIYVD